MVGDILFWLLWPIAVLNVGVLFGAQFWADRRKTSGESSPSTLPGFLTLSDWVGLEITSRLYSDLHHRYGSRFISHCVRIARLTMPLTFALVVANGIVVITGG